MLKKKNPKITIGFIGLGLMGQAFSKNLIADGHRLVGTDVQAGAKRKFKRLGGETLESPRAVAEAAEVVFISVPNSKISLQTARGKDGYLACSPELVPEAVLDTTTSDPEDSKKHAELCRGKGIPYLDACVSGNSDYVANREGLFLVGGNRKAYDKVAPLLETMLSDQIYCGPSGLRGRDESGRELHDLHGALRHRRRPPAGHTQRIRERFFCSTRSREARGRLKYVPWPRRLHGAGRFRRPRSTLNVILKDIGLGLRLARRHSAVTPVGNACAPLFQRRRARRPWRIGQRGGLFVLSGARE